MSSARVYGLTTLLFIITLTVLFLNLGDKNFWASHMESRRAEIAKQMVVTGDYLVPKLNGEKIFTKPPLFYWMIAASYNVTGKINEWAGRLPSAFFGALTILLLFLLGRALYDPLTGIISAFTLLTAHLFTYYARLAEMDILLTFFVTLAICFATLILYGKWTGKIAPFLLWGAMALGFLVKGPYALIFPLVAFFTFLLLKRDGWLMHIKTVFNPWAILTFAVIVAPWFLYVIFYDDAWIVFNEEVIGRISSHRGHSERGLFFYFESLSNFLPWALLLPFAIFFAMRDIGKNAMALSWLVGGFLVASLVTAKNHHYILPLYPAMALLVGQYIRAHIEGGLAGFYGFAGVTKWIGLLISLAAVTAITAFPLVFYFITYEISPVLIASFFLIPPMLYAFNQTWRFSVENRAGELWSGVFALVITLFIFAHAFAIPALNNMNSYKNFMLQSKKIIEPDAGLAMYAMENFQTTFYLDRTVTPLADHSLSDERIKELKLFLRGLNKDNYYVFTKKKYLSEVLKTTGGEVVLADDYFIAPGKSRELERLVLVNGKKTPDGGIK
ncbi:hypothetical protein MNBD_NITROSPINAE01-1918 [hydrothermal vent metagenome]|uniref:Glycosyltransferase RgtA/B/C/D-like domain-containing protein n=1 Tax=hydrothermal vent metagenome TaxID=652676 RepID=A0A3B1C6U9_9ZZZZ